MVMIDHDHDRPIMIMIPIMIGIVIMIPIMIMIPPIMRPLDGRVAVPRGRLLGGRVYIKSKPFWQRSSLHSMFFTRNTKEFA